MIKTHIINSTTAEYTDSELSWFQTAVLTAGYFATQDGDRTAKVVQKTIPSMSVDIQAGKLLLPFTKAGISWKIVAELTGESIVIAPNTSGVNRVDSIIIKCDTTLDPNTLKSNIASAVVIQGAGTTPLSDSAIQTVIGANFTFLRLADITVSNGATSIIDTNIANVVEKVKASKAIDFDGDAIVYNNSSVSGDFISELSTEDITEILQPISLTSIVKYQTDESIYGGSETVQSLTGGDILPSDTNNCRQGIYTMFGYDWFFFLVNGVINYSRKVSNTNGSWSARVSTGISVMNQSNKFWTMGADEKLGRFFFAYAKNAGLSDGKVYYNMAQASAGGLVVSNEVVAWTNTTWKIVQNGMDSEVVNGVYYVIFQNTNGSGNYKATIIGNSTLTATWTNALGVPHDMDSDYASSQHGVGGAVGGIGNKKVGFICNRCVTISTYPYQANYCIYKELDTVSGSFGSVIPFGNGTINNPSYGYDMTRNTSVSFLDGQVFVSYGISNTSGYGDDTIIVRRVDTPTVDFGSSMSEKGGSSSLNYNGQLATLGDKIYSGCQITDGGGSNAFNTPYCNYGIDGIGAKDNNVLASGGGGSAYNYNLFTKRPGTSNSFGVVAWLKGAQKGNGIQNAIGFIHKNGYTNQIQYVNYIKYYEVAPTIHKTDFNSTQDVKDFVGFNIKQIVNGAYGEVKVSGLLGGFSGLKAGSKYYISKDGLVNYELENSIFVGIAKNSSSIQLDIRIDSYTKANVASYFLTGSGGLVKLNYDGELIYFAQDVSGSGWSYKRQSAVVAKGDLIDFSSPPFNNGGTPPLFRRLK